MPPPYTYYLYDLTMHYYRFYFMFFKQSESININYQIAFVRTKIGQVVRAYPPSISISLFMQYLCTYTITSP